MTLAVSFTCFHRCSGNAWRIYTKAYSVCSLCVSPISFRDASCTKEMMVSIWSCAARVNPYQDACFVHTDNPHLVHKQSLAKGVASSVWQLQQCKGRECNILLAWAELLTILQVIFFTHSRRWNWASPSIAGTLAGVERGFPQYDSWLLWPVVKLPSSRLGRSVCGCAPPGYQASGCASLPTKQSTLSSPWASLLACRVLTL